MWFARCPLPVGTPWARAQACPVWLAEDATEACHYSAAPLAGVPGEVVLVRLQPVSAMAGAADGQPVHWHYVVATDVPPAHEAEFNAWYDTEHLPGLAAVPGVVRAQRWRVVQGDGPRHHACYDLATRSAFNSTAWLAVRATPWSSRVRPHFMHTRRTMYRLQA